MFLDDDAVLNLGWWEWVLQNELLDGPEIGEIWSINWDSTPERMRFLRMFGINLKEYLIRKFYDRGGTHDTIYRRAAIDGIKIPPELHVYEDAFLHHYVNCRGFKSIINPIGVTHYHSEATMIELKREKEKAKLAIYAAINYGIVEYETSNYLSIV